jgi:predicted amidohydrolase
MAERIIEAIALSGWNDVEAVLMPGGFLRLPDPIGHLDEIGRREALLSRPVVRALGELSRRLARGASPTLLVVGIDLKPLNRRIGGDQMVAAWRDGELVALVRKTFPANGDTDGWGPVYPVYEEDFVSPSRIVALPNDQRAVLLGCYDAFGVRGIVDERHCDLTAMRLARDRDGELRAPAMAIRRNFLGQWRSLIAAHRPHLALVAIHNFVRPGADGYWQRHGIAGASAALGGIPVIGASHFNEALPEDPVRSPLAAAGVPLAHLEQGNRREPNALRPDASIILAARDGSPLAIIRRFNCLAPTTRQRNIW